MKNFLLFLFFIPAFLSVKAQKVDFSIEEKINGRTLYSDILGGYEHSIYVVRFDKKSNQTFVLQRYNKQMKVADIFEFKVDKDKNVDKILLANGKVLVFHSEYDKQEKSYKLFCDVLNAKLNLEKKNKFIAATKIKPGNNKIFKVANDFYTGNILVFYPSQIANDNIYFSALVLTNELFKVYEHNLNIAPEKEFIFDQLHLTGDAFVLIFKSREGNVLKMKQDFYTLMYYDFSLKEKHLVNLYNDSLRFDNILFRYNKLDENYMIGGLYTAYERSDQKGIALLTIDRKSSKADFKYFDFEPDVVMQIMGRSKNYSGIKNYYPLNIVQRTDGGVILFTEYFDIQKEMYSDYYNINHSYVKYYYNYSDIVVYSISKEGVIDWYKIIRKDQLTLNDEGYYSSFMTGVVKDKMVLVYNDFTRSSWNMLADILAPDGSIKSKILVKESDFKGYLIPRMGKQTSANEFVVPGFGHKKGFVLMRVSL